MSRPLTFSKYLKIWLVEYTYFIKPKNSKLIITSHCGLHNYFVWSIP